MQQDTVRSILRIIAVTTVMIGVILVLQTLIQAGMMSSLSNQSLGNVSFNMPAGLSGKVSFYTFLSQACISFAGLILYWSSPLVADKIVGIE